MILSLLMSQDKRNISLYTEFYSECVLDNNSLLLFLQYYSENLVLLYDSTNLSYILFNKY